MSTSKRRQAVIVCVVASCAAYFLFSRALRAALAGEDYRRLLWKSFLTGPRGPLIEPMQFDWAGLLAIGALTIAALATGVLLSRHRDTAEILVYAMAAVVVPTLLIATLFWPDGRGWLRTDVLLGATVLMALVLLPRALEKRRQAGAVQSASRWIFVFAVPVSVYAAILIVFALSSLRGFDSLAYHLPLAASWLRHSTLTTNVEESATFFFPSNGEIFVRWILASGTDRLAFVPAFLAAIGCLYAIYKIAREIGQSREAAAISSLCASSCILLGFIATSAYIDAFMALNLLLATLFLLRTLKSRPGASIALGTAIGLALGSKYSAIPPAAVISAVWLWHVLRRHFRPYEGCLRILDIRACTREVLSFVVPLVLCCGYWYIRNTVEHGNPLFPFAIAGLRGLPNATLIAVRPEAATPLDWLIYPWREMPSPSFEDILGGVFGGVALIGLVAAVARRNPVALIAVACFVLWLVTGNFVPRYGIFPVLLTFVFVGDLWTEYRSVVLRFATLAVLVATLLVFGRGLATDAIYVTIKGRPRYGVPRAVDTLPPAKILNATSSMANYYLMGRDYRHEVITTFAKALPDDLLRFKPDYVLLGNEDAPAFRHAADLEPIAASDSGDVTPAVLYRVRPTAEVRTRP